MGGKRPSVLYAESNRLREGRQTSHRRALRQDAQQQPHGLEEVEAARDPAAAPPQPGESNLRGGALQQDLLSRSRGPFLEYLLSLAWYLATSWVKLFIDDVERQELFDHAGEQEYAAAHELLFVEFHVRRVCRAQT